MDEPEKRSGRIPATVDEYVAAFSGEKRVILEKGASPDTRNSPYELIRDIAIFRIQQVTKGK